MTEVTKMRADEIKEGMWLDLEGDTFAAFYNGDARRNSGVFTEDQIHQGAEDHDNTISTFEFEYAEVESTERETEDCIVVHTTLTSFGCPPDHMFKVVNKEDK